MDGRYYARTSGAGIRSLVQVAGSRDGESVWIQIAYEGSWEGHGAGSFELTGEIFEQVVRNFSRRADDVPVLHGHPGVGSADAAKEGAAGWISDLRVAKDDEGRTALFAKTKWTDRSAAKIAADEYRYCSVVLAFDSIDEVTGDKVGAELLELGIVPAAFLDGMTRLAASRAGRKLAQKQDSKMELNEIIKRAQKELPEGFTRDQLVGFIDAEEAKAAAIEGGEPEPEEPEAEEPALDDAPAIEASAEVPSDVVEAAADMPADEPAEDDGSGARDVAADFLEAMATDLGIDLPALLASMDENRDAILGAIGGAPEEGTTADGEGLAAMSASHSGAVVSLAQSEVQRVELSARVAVLEAKAELDGFEVELSRHCVAGEILDQTRIELMAIAVDEDYGDKALTVAGKALAAALEKGTGISLGGAGYKPAKPSEGKATDAKTEVSALSANERVFYDTHKALGKPHAESLTLALAKGA